MRAVLFEFFGCLIYVLHCAEEIHVYYLILLFNLEPLKIPVGNLCIAHHICQINKQYCTRHV